jgi:AMMECR1 domain-containing protein
LIEKKERDKFQQDIEKLKMEVSIFSPPIKVEGEIAKNFEVGEGLMFEYNTYKGWILPEEVEDDGLDELSKEFVKALVDKIMDFMKVLVSCNAAKPIWKMTYRTSK